jgi:hypothetical protein
VSADDAPVSPETGDTQGLFERGHDDSLLVPAPPQQTLPCLVPVCARASVCLRACACCSCYFCACVYERVWAGLDLGLNLYNNIMCVYGAHLYNYVVTFITLYFPKRKCVYLGAPVQLRYMTFSNLVIFFVPTHPQTRPAPTNRPNSAAAQAVLGSALQCVCRMPDSTPGATHTLLHPTH